MTRTSFPRQFGWPLVKMHLNAYRKAIYGIAVCRCSAVGATGPTRGSRPSGLLVIPTLARIPVQASEHGWVETPYPLTPFAPGESFAAQYAFRNSAACQGPRPWSTSNALLVTVQP